MNEVTIAFAVVGGVIGFWALLVWVCKRRESAPQREAAQAARDFADLALADLQRTPRAVYYGTPSFWSAGPRFWRAADLVGTTGQTALVTVESTADPKRAFFPEIVGLDDWGRFIAGREPVKFYGTPAPTSATVATGPWPIQNVAPPATTPDLLDEYARQDEADAQRRADLAQLRAMGDDVRGTWPHFRNLREYIKARAEHRGRMHQNERDSIPYRPRGGPDA